MLGLVHSGPSRGRRVHPVSRGLTLTRVGVVWFIQVRRVHYGALMDRRFHSDSCGFTRALLKVAGFILVRVDSIVRSLWSPGLFGIAWIHLRAIGVVGLILFRVGSFRRDKEWSA